MRLGTPRGSVFHRGDRPLRRLQTLAMRRSRLLLCYGKEQASTGRRIKSNHSGFFGHRFRASASFKRKIDQQSEFSCRLSGSARCQTGRDSWRDSRICALYPLCLRVFSRSWGFAFGIGPFRFSRNGTLSDLKGHHAKSPSNGIKRFGSKASFPSPQDLLPKLRSGRAYSVGLLIPTDLTGDSASGNSSRCRGGLPQLP